MSARLLEPDGGTVVGLSLHRPLGGNRSATVAANHAGGRNDVVAGLRQVPDYDGGWGWGSATIDTCTIQGNIGYGVHATAGAQVSISSSDISNTTPTNPDAVEDGSGAFADDGAALHFVGEEVVQVVASRRDARAFRVELRHGHVVTTQLGTRFLGDADCVPLVRSVPVLAEA